MATSAVPPWAPDALDSGQLVQRQQAQAQPEIIEIESDSDGFVVSDDSEDGYDTAFEHDRRVNDERLKSRFESIFAKYGKDFTGVGDEIDLATGRIVVDNGHLARMQHEADPGDSASAEFVEAFAENLKHEEDSSDELGTAESDDSDDEMDSADESTAGDIDNSIFSAAEQTAESNTSPVSPDEIPIDPLLETMVTEAALLNSAALALPSVEVTEQGSNASHTRLQGRSQSTDDPNSRPGTSAPLNVMDLPGVKESMLALTSQQHNGNGLDHEAINALGKSIANQLARLIGNGKSKSKSKQKKRKDATWDYPELPADKRIRVRSPPRSRPQLPRLTSVISPGRKGSKVYEAKESLWAPPHRPAPRKPRKPAAVETQAEDTSAETAREDQEREKSVEHVEIVNLKSCTNCGVWATTAWRCGPDGDLCNACGMYLYNHGLMKPLPAKAQEHEPDLAPELAAAPDTNGADLRYAANTSRPIKKAVRKYKSFTPDEDALIIKLKEFDELSWEQIGSHFKGRTAFAVQCRYSKILSTNGKRSEDRNARNALIEQGFDFEELERKANGGFSKKEDEIILQSRKESEMRFDAIAQQMPNQTAESIEARYKLLSAPKRKTQRPNPRNGLPEHSGTSYSPEENVRLIKSREVDKISWETIATWFPGRTNLSIQKRYVRELDNRKTIVSRGGIDPYAHLFTGGQCSPLDLDEQVMEKRKQMLDLMEQSHFSKSEDLVLIRLREDEKLPWEKIALQFPARSVELLRARLDYLKAKAVKPSISGVPVEDPSVYDIPISDDTPPGAEKPLSKAPKKAKSNPYTKAEDRLILKKYYDGHSWEEIAEHLPGRTAGSLEARYNKKLKHVPVVSGDAPSANRPLEQNDAISIEYSDSDSEAVVKSITKGEDVDSDQDPDHVHQVQESLWAQDSGALPLAKIPGLEDLSDGDLQASSAFVTGSLNKLAPGRRFTKREEAMVWKFRSRGTNWDEMVPFFRGRTAQSLEYYWKNHMEPGRRVQIEKQDPDQAPAALGTRTRRVLDRSFGRRGSSGEEGKHNLFSLLQRGGTTAIVADEIPVTPSTARWKKSTKVSKVRGLHPKQPPLLPQALSSLELLDEDGEPILENSERIDPADILEPTPFAPQRALDPTPEISGWEDSEDELLSTGEVDDSRIDENGMDALAPCSPVLDDDDQLSVYPATPTMQQPEEPQTELSIAAPSAQDSVHLSPAGYHSYYTPSRYNVQSHPYFSAPMVQMYSPIREEDRFEQDSGEAQGTGPDQDAAYVTLIEEDSRAALAKKASGNYNENGELDDDSMSTTGDIDFHDDALSEDESADEPRSRTPYVPPSPPAAALNGDTQAPPFSLNELVAMALKSIPSQRLSTNGIHLYLQEKFPYFKTCASGWKKTLQKHLQRSSEFEWSGAGAEESWGFAEKSTPLPPSKNRKGGRAKKKQAGEQFTSSGLGVCSDPLWPGTELVGEDGVVIKNEDHADEDMPSNAPETENEGTSNEPTARTKRKAAKKRGPARPRQQPAKPKPKPKSKPKSKATPKPRIGADGLPLPKRGVGRPRKIGPPPPYAGPARKRGRPPKNRPPLPLSDGSAPMGFALSLVRPYFQSDPVPEIQSLDRSYDQALADSDMPMQLDGAGDEPDEPASEAAPESNHLEKPDMPMQLDDAADETPPEAAPDFNATTLQQLDGVSDEKPQDSASASSKHKIEQVDGSSEQPATPQPENAANDEAGEFVGNADGDELGQAVRGIPIDLPQIAQPVGRRVTRSAARRRPGKVDGTSHDPGMSSDLILSSGLSEPPTELPSEGARALAATACTSVQPVASDVNRDPESSSPQKRIEELEQYVARELQTEPVANDDSIQETTISQCDATYPSSSTGRAFTPPEAATRPKRGRKAAQKKPAPRSSSPAFLSRPSKASPSPVVYGASAPRNAASALFKRREKARKQTPTKAARPARNTSKKGGSSRAATPARASSIKPSTRQRIKGTPRASSLGPSKINGSVTKRMVETPEPTRAADDSEDELAL
jgi:hypothetical protein